MDLLCLFIFVTKEVISICLKFLGMLISSEASVSYLSFSVVHQATGSWSPSQMHLRNSVSSSIGSLSVMCPLNFCLISHHSRSLIVFSPPSRVITLWSVFVVNNIFLTPSSMSAFSIWEMYLVKIARYTCQALLEIGFVSNLFQIIL